VIAAGKLGEPSNDTTSPEVSAALDVMQALDPKERPTMSVQTADALRLLWSDDQFLNTWSRRQEFQVLDSCFELATNLMSDKDWGMPGYTPTMREMYLSHIHTNGIVEETFKVRTVSTNVS
jgi:hypothetical protein